MQQVNLHQQRIIALVIAGVMFISLLLKWTSPKYEGYTGGQNGFHSWGYLAVIGILGVIIVTFIDNNKARPYEGQMKQLALGGFGLAALGALIYLVRLLTGSADTGFGQKIKFTEIAKPGIGLFLCLILAIAGLAWVYGVIKMPASVPHTPGSTPPPPPPPPPPGA